MKTVNQGSNRLEPSGDDVSLSDIFEADCARIIRNRKEKGLEPETVKILRMATPLIKRVPTKRERIMMHLGHINISAEYRKIKAKVSQLSAMKRADITYVMENKV